MSEETSRVVVFNPGGFILKMIFSIVAAYMLVKNEDGFLHSFIGFLLTFVLMYLIGTLFGLAVNATGNYAVGIVVFVLLVFGFCFILDQVETFLIKYGSFGKVLFELFVLVVFAWPLIKDIKKAILYFRHTV